MFQLKSFFMYIVYCTRSSTKIIWHQKLLQMQGTCTSCTQKSAVLLNKCYTSRAFPKCLKVSQSGDKSITSNISKLFKKCIISLKISLSYDKVGVQLMQFSDLPKWFMHLWTKVRRLLCSSISPMLLKQLIMFYCLGNYKIMESMKLYWIYLPIT